MTERNNTLEPSSLIINSPKMVGSSSSHNGACFRAAQICRGICGGRVTKIDVDLVEGTPLGGTYHEHGSHMGLCAGLLGWEAVHPDMANFEAAIQSAGIQVNVNIAPQDVHYPDTHGEIHHSYYRLKPRNAQESHCIEWKSVGSGMIQIVKIDGAEVSLAGDRYILLVFNQDTPEGVAQSVGDLPNVISAKVCVPESDTNKPFVLADSAIDFNPQTLAELRSAFGANNVRVLPLVLPVATPERMDLPFRSFAELLELREQRGGKTPLWQFGLEYEVARGGVSQKFVWNFYANVLAQHRASYAEGMRGLLYAGRLLPPQAKPFADSIAFGFFDRMVLGFRRRFGLPPGKRRNEDTLENSIIQHVMAALDCKSSMKPILAGPTAGSCGVNLGILGMVNFLNRKRWIKIPDEKIIQSYLAGGVIATIVDRFSTFAAEGAGCMGECGAASAENAVAYGHILDCTFEESIAAASKSLIGAYGLACATFGNGVESPCTENNVFAATRAYAALKLARGGVINPLDLKFDSVVQGMEKIAKQMPVALRCSGGDCGACGTEASRLYQLSGKSPVNPAQA